MIVVAFVAYQCLEFANGHANTLLTRAYPVAELILNADRDLYQSQLALGAAHDATDPAQRENYLTIYEANRDQSRARLSKAEAASLRTTGEAETWSRYHRARQTWQTKADALADTLRQGGSFEDLLAQMQAIAEPFAQMRHHIDRLEEEFYEPMLRRESAKVNQVTRDTEIVIGVALLVGLIVSSIASWVVVAAIRRQERMAEADSAAREAEQREKDFERRLVRALDMAETEADALATAAQAIEQAVPDRSVELLLADSSMAHMKLAMCTSNTDHRQCPVGTPKACPAVRRSTPLDFADSRQFDVCPHLKEHLQAECSAACMPVSVMGRAVGVLHAVGAVEQQPTAKEHQRLATVAKLTGDRLGLIRAFADSQRQATTDPLTGLTNRRSMEDQVKRLRLSHTPYCIAYGDIDHFKRLNDDHGHETGDRALRLFAEIARKSVRPDDIVGRWGGEEFVIILPNLPLHDARRVIERVRTNLAQRLSEAAVPTFTVSFGLTRTEHGDPFDQRLAQADHALLRAKEGGRDRVVVIDTPLELTLDDDAAQDATEENPPAGAPRDLTQPAGDARREMAEQAKMPV